MKTFNLLLVVVLALGVFAFAPQSEAMAGGGMSRPDWCPEGWNWYGSGEQGGLASCDKSGHGLERQSWCPAGWNWDSLGCILPGGGSGTVTCTGDRCQSGYDMADCSKGACKLMNGYNFINVPAGPYKVYAQTLTSAPGGPAGLTLQPKPVNIYFSPAETLAFVEVCFPKGSGSGQVFKHSNAGWLPLPTTFVNGLACGTAWGGGTFGYFK